MRALRVPGGVLLSLFGVVVLLQKTVGSGTDVPVIVAVAALVVGVGLLISGPFHGR